MVQYPRFVSFTNMFVALCRVSTTCWWLSVVTCVNVFVWDILSCLQSTVFPLHFVQVSKYICVRRSHYTLLKGTVRLIFLME